MRTLQHPTFMLNKLAGVKFDTTAAMLAKTGDELWRFDCSFAHGRYSNVLCPVRPPQTAIGRTAGTLLGSAPVPVAVFGVAPKTVSQTEWFQQWFWRDAHTPCRMPPARETRALPPFVPPKQPLAAAAGRGRSEERR